MTDTNQMGGDAVETVVSKDGTTIAFDRYGEGPPLILVSGATATRAAETTFAQTISEHFTVFAYDRRGRVDSGDTQPYAVEREIEDLEALIEEAGGSAFVFGHSSGGVLALRAAANGLEIPKLAVYEPPFIVDDSRPPVPNDYVEHLDQLISEGRKGAALAYFMTTAVGTPEEFIEQIRSAPFWSMSESVAHTIPYDGRVMGGTMSGKPLSESPWDSIKIPTLVMDGGASEGWIRNGVRQLAEILPNSRRITLEGQDHGPADEVLAPALVEFFGSR